MASAVIKAFEYLAGIAIFGIIFMFLDMVIQAFSGGLGDNSALHQLAMYLWAGSLVVYLVFGAFYFLSSLKEWDVLR